MMTTQILNKAQTLQKIKRIAFEIYENNFQEEEIILAGIWDRGYFMAEKLQTELALIAPFRMRLVKVSLDKFTPTQTEISLDCEPENLQKKAVVLVDDVLNSGRTLIYSLRPFLKTEIKNLQVAVLVKRSYKSFPVSATYTGYELATTLQEHIEVILDDEEKMGVYLY
jgi:pyrimidine operon attenuation protein / uracil phosphoribosyltransferase